MAPFLGEVERFLERAFEAPARRLFRPRLQPMEVARAIGRAMEADSRVGPLGLQVPNHYVVQLHPDDFRGFASSTSQLQREMSAYVQQRAIERGWHCPGRPRVEVQAEASVGRGHPRVHTSVVDEPSRGASRDPATMMADAAGGTAVFEVLPPVASDGPVVRSTAWLEVPGRQPISLNAPVVRLGRAEDNDVVLPDPRVSRYHAQIHRAGDRFTLVDLGSMNGTRVGSQPVAEQVLRGGETIYLGGVPLRFHGPR